MKTQVIIAMALYFSIASTKAETPTFANCFGDIMDSYIESAHLSFSCDVVTTSLYNITCSILTYKGEIEKSTHYTEGAPSFWEIGPLTARSKYLRCTAVFPSIQITTETNFAVKHKPFAPSSFLIGEAIKDSLTVTWNQLSADESGSGNTVYFLQYVNGTLLENETMSNFQQANLTGIEPADGVFKYTFTNLVVGETYTMRLFAENDEGKGDVTQNVTTVTLAKIPTFKDCFQGVRDSYIESGHMVFMCDVATTSLFSITCSVLTFEGKIEESYHSAEGAPSFWVLGPLTARSKYIRCTAVIPSFQESITTETNFTIKHKPLAPSSFRIGEVTKDSLTVTWKQLSANESGDGNTVYYLQYVSGRLLENETMSNFEQVSLTGIEPADGVFKYTFTNLVVGETYTMRLFAENDELKGDVTQIVKTYTLDRLSNSSTRLALLRAFLKSTPSFVNMLYSLRMEMPFMTSLISGLDNVSIGSSLPESSSSLSLLSSRLLTLAMMSASDTIPK